MSVRHFAPVFGLILLAGCNPDPEPVLYPLTGTLTRDGRPVTEGSLIFIPESGGWGGNVVNASVSADGTFAAETSRTSSGGVTTTRPGAPAGMFKAVYHPLSDGQKVGLETELPERVTVEAKENAVKLVLPVKQ